MIFKYMYLVKKAQLNVYICLAKSPISHFIFSNNCLLPNKANLKDKHTSNFYFCVQNSTYNNQIVDFLNTSFLSALLLKDQ